MKNGSGFMKNKLNIIKNIILITAIVLYSYLIFIGRNQYIFNVSCVKCIIYMILVSLFIFIYGLVDNTKKTYNTNIIIYIILYYRRLENEETADWKPDVKRLGGTGAYGRHL